MIGMMLCVAGIVMGAATTEAPATNNDATVKPIPAWQLVRQGEEDTPGGKLYTAVVSVPTLSLSVPFMHCTENSNLGREVDPETVQLAWLNPSSILWIHCYSMSVGSGGYRIEMHVIVSLATSPARELVRESFWARGKQGWGNYQKMNVEYRLQSSTSGETILYRTLTYDNSERDLPEGTALTVTTKEGMRYRQFRIIQENECRTDPKEGPFVSPQRRLWLDLAVLPLFDMDIPEYKDHEFPLPEVAEFLVRYLHSREKHAPKMATCLPEERDKMQSALQKENLGPNLDKNTRTRIAVPLDGFKEPLRPIPPKDESYPLR